MPGRIAAIRPEQRTFLRIRRHINLRRDSNDSSLVIERVCIVPASGVHQGGGWLLGRELEVGSCSARAALFCSGGKAFPPAATLCAALLSPGEASLLPKPLHRLRAYGPSGRCRRTIRPHREFMQLRTPPILRRCASADSSGPQLWPSSRRTGLDGPVCFQGLRPSRSKGHPSFGFACNPGTHP
jgi:hypothetical protein